MTNRNNHAAPEDTIEELSTLIELSDEDTDLVGGGPQVDNDPPNG